MAAHSINPYEAAARAMKTAKLASTLIASGISADDARRMNEGQWHMAAMAARTTPPSRITVEAVITQLDSIAAAQTRNAGLDPFRGF